MSEITAALLLEANNPMIGNISKNISELIFFVLIELIKYIKIISEKNSPIVSALGNIPLQATLLFHISKPNKVWLLVPYFESPKK